MAKLIYVQLETCHDNTDGVAWYAYWEGRPTEEQLLAAWYAYWEGRPTEEQLLASFDDGSLVGGGPLGWDGVHPEEVPNPLSRHAGLTRWFLSQAC